MTATIKRELSPDTVAWLLSQLVEDFAAAVAPVSINRAMRESYVSDVDMNAAVLAPVSFAAVVSDVCERLGVVTPWAIRRALGDELAPDNAA